MGGILSKCRSLLSKWGASSSKSTPQKPVSIDQQDTVSLRNNEDEMRLTASNSLSEAEAKASMTQYGEYISSYVDKCPFHLFDTKRKRNISRTELKDDISASLGSWIKIPLTCSDILEVISNFDNDMPSGWEEDLRPFILSAMARSPLVDDETRFISSLDSELQTYKTMSAPRDLTSIVHVIPAVPMPLPTILLAVRELINAKRAQTSIPSQRVHEQIEFFGQYAILSHRWDGEELSFDDVANFSHPTVQAKTGFKKLVGFAKVVESRYGCRYLWVDSACISEPDRSVSIPQMFTWYRRAYVCVIYLTATQSVSEDSQPAAVYNPLLSTAVSEDLWATRGWTLQEFLAASRVKCFTGDWRPVDDAGGTPKFDAYREQRTSSLVYSDLVNTTGSVDWLEYNPGVDQAIEILQAMCTRKTTKPEDMVYSVLSSLNLDIPVKYGEGFDSAFYCLQVQILSKVTDRGLLSWEKGTPSPYNSMLAGCFTAWGHTNCEDVYSEYPDFDPTISFDSNGVMRIMASLHTLHTSPAQPHVYALLGTEQFTDTYVGVMLRRLPGEVPLYRRIGLKELEYGETLPEKAPQWVYIQ